MGYVLSLLIGILLGLVGAGGSILTIPMLVYLMHIPPLLATSYSLVLVGGTSGIGAWRQWQIHNLDIKTAVMFGSPSIIVVFCIRRWVIGNLPQTVFIAGHGFALGQFTMLLFASLMIAAAICMVRVYPSLRAVALKTESVFFNGIGVGIVTGLLGAGGGFLIIPVLVVKLHLPMKKAIGCSLLIIAMNSLCGFVTDLGRVNFDWNMLGLLLCMSLVGLLIGLALAQKMSQILLKKVFGWLLFVMGVAIIFRELSLIF